MGHDDLLCRDNLNHIMDMFRFSISVFLLLSSGFVSSQQLILLRGYKNCHAQLN